MKLKILLIEYLGYLNYCKILFAPRLKILVTQQEVAVFGFVSVVLGCECLVFPNDEFISIGIVSKMQGLF